MEASTDLFINIIQNHRIIYDTRSKDFKNVNKKEDEWLLIAKESRMGVEAAKKRYASLRQKYARKKKKEITCNRSKTIFRPSVYFDRLSFFNDFVKPRRTNTNDVDGMDMLDDDMDGLNVPEETPYTSLFTDGNYSLAQEVADDEAALAEMERHGLLPVEEEAANIVFEVEPIAETTAGDILMLNATEGDDDIIEMGAQQSIFSLTQRQEGQSSMNNNDTQSTITRPPFDLLDNIRENESYMPNSQASIETQPTRLQSVSNRNNNGGSSPRLNLPTSSNLCVRDRSIEPRHDNLSNMRQVNESQTTQLSMTVNRNQSTGKVTSSIFSKNSPLVQAVTAVHDKNRPLSKTTNNTGSMDAIKEKMEAYLKACNEKLQKKSDRSPHARFLSYLGTKMENVSKDKIETLEQELLSVIYRYSEKN